MQSNKQTNYSVHLWRPLILRCVALRAKKAKKERKKKKNAKMCGCKEIRLECRVRECMTENHRGKLCPASRLARAQKTWAEETETQTAAGDSGACPTKMWLNPGRNKHNPTPKKKKKKIQRCLWLSAVGICAAMLSDGEEFGLMEYEPLKDIWYHKYTCGKGSSRLL